MPSRKVNVGTAEVSNTQGPGIYDLVYKKKVSTPLKYMPFTDTIPIGSTVTVPNPVTIWETAAGIQATAFIDGRNPGELRHDAHQMLTGSGVPPVDFQVSGKYLEPARTVGGELTLNHLGVGIPSKFTMPTPAN